MSSERDEANLTLTSPLPLAPLPLLTLTLTLLSPLTLTQLPQLLYPCSHSYCKTRRLLLTLTLTFLGPNHPSPIACCKVFEYTLLRQHVNASKTPTLTLQQNTQP